jgi:hypothetical protein
MSAKTKTQQKSKLAIAKRFKISTDNLFKIYGIVTISTLSFAVIAVILSSIGVIN